MENRSQWSLVEFERLITGKALVNPNAIPKQMFISTKKALFRLLTNSDKIGYQGVTKKT